MSELKYTGNVDENGVLKIVHRKDFDEDLKRLAGKKLIIKISRYRKTKSNKQNAYYWGCVIPFVYDGLVDMGFEKTMLDPETIHDMLKGKFLKIQLVTDDSEFIEIVRDYHNLTTTEHMDYVAQIQQWAAEFLNIVIPDPEKQAEMPLSPKPI